MKVWTRAAVMAMVMAAGVVATDADARRLGGGKSTGMQRDMPARTAPDAAPARPATPQQQQQQAAPSQQPGAAAAPAAPPPRRSWMGPLAGLAAGLGLAALMSHLGLGEAFGSLLLVALLVLAAVVVLRLVMRRAAPATAGGPGAGASAPGGHQVAWPKSAAAAEPASATQAAPAAPLAPAAAPLQRAFVPAAFDSESFARTAKLLFIRLQAANDAGDLDDLRAFTTPEMFAELSLDLRERGGTAQRTEVLDIKSEVLDVSQDETRQIVSVRFRGEVREADAAPPAVVDEVWHLAKPLDGNRPWVVAGIEQWH